MLYLDRPLTYHASMPEQVAPPRPILCVCLNPVVQKTLVFDRLVKGEVNRAREHRVDASGKGVNVARVLVESGRPAIHLTQAGGPTREWFLSLAAADGLDIRWVESESEIRFCHTVVDLAEGNATELVEEARTVGPGTGDRLLAAFRDLLPSCGALAISGTKAAGFDADIFPAMTRYAKEAGLFVVLDIKGKDLSDSLEYRPDVVKPNLQELLSTWPLGKGEAPSGSGKAASDEATIRAHVARIAAEIQERYGSRLVVTRGSRPTWYWEGGELREGPVHPIKPLNPTGSGDAFTAGLTAVLASGGSMAEAIAEGSRLGALNALCLKPGSIRGATLS